MYSYTDQWVNVKLYTSKAPEYVEMLFFFRIYLCMLCTNLKVLSGANEQFRRYDAFFLPLFFCKLPSFRLRGLPRDTTQGLLGCKSSHLPTNVAPIFAQSNSELIQLSDGYFDLYFGKSSVV